MFALPAVAQDVAAAPPTLDPGDIPIDEIRDEISDEDADAADGSSNADGADSSKIDASLSVRMEPEQTIETGQTVDVFLEVTHPPNARVTFPESFQPTRWEFLESTQVDLRANEASATTVWRLRFGLYKPGQTELEPFEVAVVGPRGEQQVLRTDPLELKVVSVLDGLNDEPEFKPARAPVAVWVEDYTLAWLGGGVGMLALFGLLLAWAAHRRKMMPEPPPPPRKPHEIALEKLGALAADEFVERGDYMFFWVRLSETIREYLGRTYDFPPTELTTTEVLGKLQDVRWPAGLDLEDVSRFLRRCDEVKFGGAEPSVEESNELLRRGFSIVELTRPRTAGEAPTADEIAQATGRPEEGEAPSTQTANSETQKSKEAAAEARPRANRWAPPEEDPARQSSPPAEIDDSDDDNNDSDNSGKEEEE